MFKIVSIVLLLVVGGLGFVLWSHRGAISKHGIGGVLMMEEEEKKRVPKPQLKKATLPQGTQQPKNLPLAQAPGQTYVVETFRGSIGDTFLHTDQDQYETGKACGRGIVVSVKNRMAIVKTPEGQSILVVAREGTAMPERAFVVPKSPERVAQKQPAKIAFRTGNSQARN